MNTDDLYDALERCAATTSKKDKLAIVQTLGEFKPWLRLALDPTLSYYISEQQFPSGVSVGFDTLDDDDRIWLVSIAKRQIAGDDALRQITARLGTLTFKSQRVLRRILLKDLRCGVGTTIVNLAFPGLVLDPPYMRCVLPKDSNMEKWNWADGIYVQLKADGMFANVDLDSDGTLTVSSRQGRPFPAGALGHLEAELTHALQLGTRTMGELTVYDGDRNLLERQIGNGMLNSVADGGELPDSHIVRFDAWDQVPLSVAVPRGSYHMPYKQRLASLRVQLNNRELAMGQVHVIDTTIVHDKAAAFEVYRAYLAKGLEGVICKHPDAIWKDGDNKDQVKLKLEVIVDLVIKGFRPGTPGKRTEATFGAVIAQSADGLLEVGVSGFKRDVEQYIHEHRDELIDTVIAVKANGVMEPTGDAKIFSLFSPRFAELRKDKMIGDSLDQVMRQFEAAVA